MPHSSNRTDQQTSPLDAIRSIQERRESAQTEALEQQQRLDTVSRIAQEADTAAAQDQLQAVQQTRRRKAADDPEDSEFFSKVGDLFKSVEDVTLALDPVGAAIRTGMALVDDERDVGDVQGDIGRTAEFGLRAARSGVVVPAAGAERLLQSGVELTGIDIPETVEVGDVKIPTDPLQTARERMDSIQGAVQEAFGNDPSAFLNITADLGSMFAAGEFAFARAGLKSLSTKTAWRLAGKGPATAVTPEAAGAARMLKDVPFNRVMALAAEGGTFTAGIPETEAKDILFGAAAGAGIGLAAETVRGVSRLLTRNKAEKVFPDQIEDIRRIQRGEADIEIENFPSFLARVDDNVQKTFISGEQGDDVVSAMKTTLSESGETGSMGAVRGLTEMDEQKLSELQQAFPNYRFRVLGRVQGDQIKDQKLLYGLDPDVELPQGTQGSAPKLTDKAIEEFKQSGLVRGQKVLVNGQEHQFQRMTDAGQALVKRGGRRPQAVPIERVARLDETAGLLKNDRLLEQFRSFKAAEQFDDNSVAFEEFWDRFVDDADESLKPHLKQYFDEQEAKLLESRLRPDERRTFEQFKQARRRLVRNEGADRLEDLAAARGHSVQRISEGRVKLTNMVDGRTRGPFRNKERAREYLRELETKIPDLTPSIPGVPSELLEGMAVPAAPKNPLIGSGDEVMNQHVRRNAPGAVKEAWFQFTAGTKRLNEALKDIEEVRDVPVWSEAAEQLTVDARRANNRGRRFADRAEKILNDLSKEDEALVEGWLRSESKGQFVRANDMSDELVERAEATRLLYEDLFNEFSTFTGSDLDAEAWYRNYAPDLRDQLANGRNDFIDLWEETRDVDVPNELKFFAEEMKTGALAQSPQASLEEKTIRLIRSGMFKAHAGESWERAFQFANEIDEAENFIAKKKLVDYLAGFRGGSKGAVREYLDQTMRRIYAEAGVRNPGDKSRNIIDGAVDMSYGGLIGYQPELVMRQAFQMPAMLGPMLDDVKGVVRAQQLALKNDALRKWAERIGARTFRVPTTFGEGLEDVSGAGKIARAAKSAGRKGLNAYTNADDWNRITAAIATRRKVDPLITKFQAGDLNETELLNQSGIGFLSRPEQTRFLNLLEGSEELDIPGASPAERARNYAARQMSDVTNFLYGQRNSQRWMRSTLGRVAFSYSTWPSGYLNYVDRIAKAAKRGDVSKGRFVKAMAKHGALNTAIKAGGAAAGVNTSSWVMWGSLAFNGGPILDLGKNLWTGLMGPSWEREEAWENVANLAPRALIPGGQLVFDNIPTALERLDQSREKDAFWELMGFSTPREGEEISPVPMGVR